MPHISECKEGDIIMDSRGGKCQVLARLNNLVARSTFHFYDTFSEWITIENLEAQGWKLLVDGKEVLSDKEAGDILNAKIIKLD